MKQIKRALLER